MKAFLTWNCPAIGLAGFYSAILLILAFALNIV